MNSDNYSAEQPQRASSGWNPPHPSNNGARPASEYEEPLQPIDQVAIRKLGGFNFLTVRQWLDVPAETQLRRIQREEVVFISRGEEVPVRQALLYLKSLRREM